MDRRSGFGLNVPSVLIEEDVLDRRVHDVEARVAPEDGLEVTDMVVVLHQQSFIGFLGPVVVREDFLDDVLTDVVDQEVVGDLFAGIHHVGQVFDFILSEIDAALVVPPLVVTLEDVDQASHRIFTA